MQLDFFVNFQPCQAKIYKFDFQNLRLGGEISKSDVIAYKGYNFSHSVFLEGYGNQKFLNIKPN